MQYLTQERKEEYAPTCGKCGYKAKLKTLNEIYNAFCYGDKVAYQCDTCDMQVGCHPHSVIPLGTLADKETRSARMKAHNIFDPLWRDLNLFPSRKSAYMWLSIFLKIGYRDCHIGLFNAKQCEKVIRCCEKKLGK